MVFAEIEKKLQHLGCDAYEITEHVTNRWEFYFIRHQLDQNRVCALTDTEVKVYRLLEDGACLGCASDVISPTASEQELEEKLDQLMFQAGLVMNPAYRLNDKPLTEDEPFSGKEREGAAGSCVEQIAEDFVRAMRSAPETESEDINSYEIFVSEISRHYKNSCGVEYRCVYPSSMLEVVVNARHEGHEIELYRNFTSGTCDKEYLAAKLAEAFRFGKDRLVAEPTPKLSRFDVVFSTQDAVELYTYFTDRTGAAYKYRRLSDWEPGQQVCGAELTVTAVPYLENSSVNFTVDEEGARIVSRDLIRDGKVANYWGSRQFSQYIGLEDSFILHNVAVSGGVPEEQVRSGDYLEIVEFSDFQIDSMTGDIAGEIRLGYLHEGGRVRIVTGGSVAGSMTEAAKDMVFSQNSVRYDNWQIPAATRLKSLRITGAVKE